MREILPEDERGPEYDAYLMRTTADELAKLSDRDLAPAIPEIRITISRLMDLVGRYNRSAA